MNQKWVKILTILNTFILLFILFSMPEEQEIDYELLSNLVVEKIEMKENEFNYTTSAPKETIDLVEGFKETSSIVEGKLKDTLNYINERVNGNDN